MSSESEIKKLIAEYAEFNTEHKEIKETLKALKLELKTREDVILKFMEDNNRDVIKSAGLEFKKVVQKSFKGVKKEDFETALKTNGVVKADQIIGDLYGNREETSTVRLKSKSSLMEE
jgi:hypothetical protein